MHDMDIEKINREHARWHILYALDRARPEPASEMLILSCLDVIRMPFTPSALRRELGYLEERELIRITGRGEHDDIWFAALTRTGIDMVEYTVPCDPGIARPVRR